MKVTMSQRRLISSFCLLIFITFSLPFAHPLSFNITEFDADTKNILYEGDATFVSRAIELNTITLASRVGRATYAEPLHLWNSATGALADFSTHFTFTVNTGSGDIYSDGLAFFLAPVGYPIPPNSAGGALGLFNTTINFSPQNQIVTVEFDTFSNVEWDPPGSHIGINVNKISSAVNVSWDAKGNSGKVANAWITYTATTNNLSVFWTNKENPLFLNNSSLSYNVDLQKVLPEQVTIGFSASTGLFPERHIIYSWEFNSNLDSNEISRKSRGRKGKKKTFVIAAVSVSFFILMLGATIGWLVVRKRKKRIHGDGKHSNVVASINMDLERLAFPKRFTYQELVTATNDFADDRRLGQGASGQVYKGIIQHLGCTVAVKRIFADSDEKVFINEVKVISRLIHRNLVQFIGWCHEKGQCLVVYAYMANGSLDNHLFGSRATLQWDFRYKIALGLASALHYLHEDAEQCVLHRDIKSANVLLDNDLSAKLGDFGIAKLVDPRFRTQTTGVVGTFGYMAPEYANGGRASKESDMFSFGVVALEIACGRRTYQDGEYHVPLCRWVWKLYLAGNILYAADESLNMNFDTNAMECLLIVGLWCTHPNSKERPKAGQVIKVLQLEAPLPELPHDRHDHPYPLPQPQQQAASSEVSLTNSLHTVGR